MQKVMKPVTSSWRKGKACCIVKSNLLFYIMIVLLHSFLLLLNPKAKGVLMSPHIPKDVSFLKYRNFVRPSVRRVFIMLWFLPTSSSGSKLQNGPWQIMLTSTKAALVLFFFAKQWIRFSFVSLKFVLWDEFYIWWKSD